MRENAAHGRSSLRSMSLSFAAAITFHGSRSPGFEYSPALRISNRREIEYRSAVLISCFSAYAARRHRLDSSRMLTKLCESFSVDAMERLCVQLCSSRLGELGISPLLLALHNALRARRGLVAAHRAHLMAGAAGAKAHVPWRRSARGQLISETRVPHADGCAGAPARKG